MKIALRSTFVLGALLLISANAYGQLEFQDNNHFHSKVSHPDVHHAPPVMPVAPELLSGRVDAGNFDLVLSTRFQFVLDSMLSVHNIMGVSAAVILPEKGTWLGAGGYSDPVAGDFMSTDMLLEIDSNTKAFVAAIILQMVEEGTLTLEDQLHQWLPPFNNVDSTISIRQILQHTGGVSDYLNDNPAAFSAILSNPDFPWTPEYAMSYVLAPNFPPGATWRYSNTGYILAGMIIREITGAGTFSVPLRQRLLSPLNLQHTFMDYEETLPLPLQLAHGWIDLNGDGILDDLSFMSRTAWTSAAWTAGAIVATAEDLATWVALLHGDQVLGPASMHEMRTMVPIPGSNLTYGLGIYTWPLFDKTLWGHDGGGIGYNSQALFYRERGVSLAVMMNQRGGSAWAGDFLAVLFREVLNYYERPHDHPYAIHAEVVPHYLQPLSGTATATADITNPDNHQAAVRAVYASEDSAVVDTLDLFDDGQHGDGAAGDNRYGAILEQLPALESNYDMNLHTSDLDSTFTHLKPTYFTTIGPVVLDAYRAIPLSANQFGIKFFLHNDGMVATAEDIRIKVVSVDSNITQIIVVDEGIGDMAAGQIDSSRYFYVNTQNQPSSVDIGLKMYSKGRLYWEDSLVNVAITGVEPLSGTTPHSFDLAQNYPNPFNPGTTIEFALATSGKTTLRVYNVLGELVAELVSGQLSAGSYKYIWKADNQASGIYFYRLEAGTFVKSRKMLLVR